MTGFYNYCNEPSGFGEFLDQVSDFYVIKTNSVPWTELKTYSEPVVKSVTSEMRTAAQLSHSRNLSLNFLQENLIDILL
jgi:hypothetical protein